jgi:glyoxylate reductase
MRDGGGGTLGAGGRGAGSGRPRVVATRRIASRALDRLAAATDLDCHLGDAPLERAELLARVAPAVGLLVMPGERVDAELCDAAPKLRAVSTVSVGYDHVDVAELSRRGIAFGNTPGVLTNATADLTFALVLGVARRLVEANQAVVHGRWPAWDPGFMLGRDLAGATLGVVGLGRIGEAVARRARAFEMNVLATTRRPREAAGLTLVDLDELLARSDFVSLHVPLGPDTRHLIGRRELAMMRPDAILINTARGAVVDEGALVDALTDGTIGGAGLDVYEEEPLPSGHPLLALENCLLLPHVGSATVETRAAMADLAVANLLAAFAGEPMPNPVPPPPAPPQPPAAPPRPRAG